MANSNEKPSQENFSFEPGQTLPVIPLRNAVIFPGTSVPIRVGRKKTISALEVAIKSGGRVVALSQRPGTETSDDNAPVHPDDLYQVGVLAKIEKVTGDAENGYHVLIQAESRVRVLKLEAEGSYMGAQIEPWPESAGVEQETLEALTTSIRHLAKDILQLLPADTTKISEVLDGIRDPLQLMGLASFNLEISVEEKQSLLEMPTLKERALALLQLMAKQKDHLQVQWEIRDKLSHRLGKLQREGILREQMKAIREELGEEESKSREDYRSAFDKAGMPDGVKQIALDELKRLESIGNISPEAHIIRNYLDLLVAMPWNKSAESTIDLDAARRVLDEDHYGMEKIKRRIIEHLAVMKLKKSGKGSILLFVGPPGVGKTSLGQSIAKALGRKFVRASLGGIRDDAEIRGHRRTYIGAMPGRIIQGIKRAGEKNPVFILDEVDKLGVSFQGDPASALLEVLDPEQNSTFLDHYLDVPFDLSEVFFIGTANNLDSISRPLLDRTEVIELSGYTTAEKLEIARSHLIKRQLADHGMTDAQLQFEDGALLAMISKFTREAGVRELQRLIASICRATAERVLNADPQELPILVTPKLVDEILGPEKYQYEVAEEKSQPGVVTGLAWTPQGGEILFIESASMPGKGNLTLTGQLGDVMKESAQIALSLVRSRLPRISPEFAFDQHDVHIHVPSGAIPKDGPSAGIAMLTSIASLVTGIGVDPRTAMTGEITLRGTVMPVGGIKEKILAAHRAGIKRVLLCKRNEKDLADIPEEIKSQLEFVFVETAADVLKASLNIEGLSTESTYYDISRRAVGSNASWNKM